MLSVVRREIGRLTSRPVYFVAMVLVPVFIAFFFVGLLNPGLPLKVPAAVVDLDHSQLSRKVTRSLDAMELIDVAAKPESYHEAMQMVQEGRILGFLMIPENFEREAVAGRGPVITYYYNLSIYVPASLMFKGFKTMAVTTSGAVVQTNLTQAGAPDYLSSVALQPITVNIHPLNNPWLNYSYYLCPSFIFGALQLMIFIMTAFSITGEIKSGTSPRWLRCAGGRIGTALVGKLLPQTVIWTILGLGINALMFRWNHFPMNGSMAWFNVGMLLYVIACQSFAVIICAILPNPRLALTVNCLTGILSFSLAAISFPTQAMYGAVAIFSDILPMRWYFLIYSDLALNGLPLYYPRMYFVYLLIFPCLAVVAAPLMKKALKKTVYVP